MQTTCMFGLLFFKRKNNSWNRLYIIPLFAFNLVIQNYKTKDA
jgi:hypothetical protein